MEKTFQPFSQNQGALQKWLGNSQVQPAFAGNVPDVLIRVMDNGYINKKLDVVYSKRVGSGNVGKGTGDFEGTLRGEKVIIKDVRTKEIVYNKRLPEDTAQLRREFNSVRKNYLTDLVDDPKKVAQLREAGLSDVDIALMKNGKVPISWQVHHKLPLDDGGTNSFDNLVLIKNEPYHKVITNAQMDVARGLKPGDSKTINWPIPDGFVYPKKPE